SRTRCPAAPVTSAPGERGPREARRTGSARLAPRAGGSSSIGCVRARAWRISPGGTRTASFSARTGPSASFSSALYRRQAHKRPQRGDLAHVVAVVQHNAQHPRQFARLALFVCRQQFGGRALLKPCHQLVVDGAQLRQLVPPRFVIRTFGQGPVVGAPIG